MQPHQQWHQLDGPYYPKSSPEEIRDLAASLTARIDADDFPDPRKTLVIADADDELLGTVSWYWHSQETYWLSVGIALYDPSNRQRGFGYEALGLWGEHLFGTMPELVRLDLRTWSGNQGMMALARKLGFREEARFRMARLVGGVHFDSVGFGVLRTEWEERHPGGFVRGPA